MNNIIDETIQAGNSVKLEVSFFDYDGITPFEPDIVKVIIYDSHYNVITTLENLAITKVDIGKYYCEYQTSTIPQYLYYEWYGEKNNMKAIKRGKIRTVFV